MKNEGETSTLQEKEILKTRKLNYITNFVNKAIHLKKNSVFNRRSSKKIRYKIFTISNFFLIFPSVFIIILGFLKIYKKLYERYGIYKSIINTGNGKFFSAFTNKKNKTVYCTDLFSQNHLYYLELLKLKYNIIETDKNPDYLIYSTSGDNHNDPKFKNSIKIFQTTLNFLPDFNECDYAFAPGFLNYEDRYIRFPYYLRRKNINDLKKERLYIPGKKFCAWVVTNGDFVFRNKFFDELSKYKPIDSGGSFRNNIGEKVEDKIIFLSDYKFSIQFENSGTPGYSTEKIFDGFKAGTIPIYYGDETIVDIINQNSFILVRNESDFKNAIELIKKIDNNDKLYKKMLKEPIYSKNFNEYRFLKEEEKIANFLYHIFDQDHDKAKRRYLIKGN